MRSEGRAQADLVADFGELSGVRREILCSPSRRRRRRSGRYLRHVAKRSRTRAFRPAEDAKLEDEARVLENAASANAAAA